MVKETKKSDREDEATIVLGNLGDFLQIDTF
jgi:hypothetical protein